MLEPLRPRRPFLVALAVSTTLAAATGRAALDAADALVPWTELTEADALASTLVRKAVVDGRTVHYPTPTKELAVELEARAASDGRAAVATFRHLAEARRELGDLPGAEAALTRWAEGSGGAAWAEAARWGALYRRWPFAFASARAALASDAPAATKRALATERIAWADEGRRAAIPSRCAPSAPPSSPTTPRSSRRGSAPSRRRAASTRPTPRSEARRGSRRRRASSSSPT